MKQKIVGTYYLGFESCKLVLREGTGGTVWFCPGKGNLPRIEIGGDEADWDQVLNSLLHDALEFSLTRANCRYYPSQDESNSSGQYLFSCDHAQFTKAVASLAFFVSSCQSDLNKAWKEWQKKKKKRK